MEGGIGVFLLLVIIVIAIVFGLALYLTGGALWTKQTDDAGDGPDGRRPRHKAPTSPTQEHTHFVGTPEGDEAARRQRAESS
jgi:hypothetical protein